MNPEDYKFKATNPQQYDSPELDWRGVGDRGDTSRVFFRNFLTPVLEDLNGKRVLDIGSGVGQLFNTLNEFGTTDIEGIEPSKRNAEYSRNLYPEIKIHEGTLQSYVSANLFDVVICIMAFEHILDIDDAFAQISKLVKTGGSFYLMIGDKDYHVEDHFSESTNFIVSVDVQELGNDVVATKTIYPTAVIYDIFRPLLSVIDSANKAGFELKKHIKMTNSEDPPSCHLLVFKYRQF